MTTTTDIYTRYNVTFTQVQACERLVNDSNRRVYYRVASAQNDGTEYTVSYNPVVKALICTCKAAEQGIGCWHKRAVQAHADEYRTNRRLLQEKEQAIAAQEIAAELAADEHEAQALRADGFNCYNRKPFQFMR